MSRRVDMDQFKKRLSDQAKRLEKAEKERASLVAYTAYLGVLGILFALPVVMGAYLGLWLDERSEGYSIIWTISLIVLGMATGVFNVYLFIRERK